MSKTETTEKELSPTTIRFRAFGDKVETEVAAEGIKKFSLDYYIAKSVAYWTELLGEMSGNDF